MIEMNEVTGFGSVNGVPDLPPGFTDRFTSRRVRTGKMTLHAVTGGVGFPLLLVGGWPQFWWQWRHVMMQLSEQFQVVAVDPRGLGLSERPMTGYDAGSGAVDLHEVMHGLGYQSFHVVGHDVGMWLAYALASDFPESVVSLTLMEANLPGISDPPSVVPTSLRLVQTQWHFMFNRLTDVNERLVAGREHVFFGDQFAVKGGSPSAIPEQAVNVYVSMLRQPGALRACFEFYRAIDVTAEQNRSRSKQLLSMPVLAVGGELSRGGSVFDDVSRLGSEVRGSIIEGCGHYIAEEAPNNFVAVLTHFIAGLN